jgi:intracellular sulfur oxidation DsrE/DsrF family protein|tara:strand:- start:84 stop:305 length:222 start_codon:yes stop_codon:yes gene_type:complete
MNITKSMIQKRITVLDSDIQKSRQKMSELEQQRIESVALLNALMGAKQQCDNFLQDLDNVEPELVSDSSDVDK